MSDPTFRPAPKPLPRTKKPKPLQRRNWAGPEARERRAERKDLRFARQYHSSEFVEFVHSLGCAIPGCERTNIQAAHVGPTKNNGGVWHEVAPLCGAEYGWQGHHAEQEESSTKAMKLKYGVDLLDVAAATAQRFMERYGKAPNGGDAA